MLGDAICTALFGWSFKGFRLNKPE